MGFGGSRWGSGGQTYRPRGSPVAGSSWAWGMRGPKRWARGLRGTKAVRSLWKGKSRKKYPSRTLFLEHVTALSTHTRTHARTQARTHTHTHTSPSVRAQQEKNKQETGGV